jgi:hypothetical protein
MAGGNAGKKNQGDHTVNFTIDKLCGAPHN